MPASTPDPLEGIAATLADMLLDRHNVVVAPANLLQLLRAQAPATQQLLQETTDPAEVAAIAADIAEAVLGPGRSGYMPAVVDNTLSVEHYELAEDLLPALHVSPAGVDAAALLPTLIAAPHVSLTFEDPYAGSGERRQSGPHQSVMLHFNPAEDYGHENCVVALGCVGCQADMFTTIVERQHGWVRRYLTQDHAWLGEAPFELQNADDSIAVISAARRQLTTE